MNFAFSQFPSFVFLSYSLPLFFCLIPFLCLFSQFPSFVFLVNSLPLSLVNSLPSPLVNSLPLSFCSLNTSFSKHLFSLLTTRIIDYQALLHYMHVIFWSFTSHVQVIYNLCASHVQGSEQPLKTKTFQSCSLLFYNLVLCKLIVTYRERVTITSLNVSWILVLETQKYFFISLKT